MRSVQHVTAVVFLAIFAAVLIRVSPGLAASDTWVKPSLPASDDALRSAVQNPWRI